MRLKFMFAPHGGPHVGVDDVGSFHGLFGIIADFDLQQTGLPGGANREYVRFSFFSIPKAHNSFCMVPQLILIP
jgi:hypothetical protein